MEKTPSRIDRHSPSEMLIGWSTGESFAVPYLEIRFECPCAVCVDEMTGRRVLKKESLAQDVRPMGVDIVGRYAVRIQWSDRHQTGMYTYDLLDRICQKHGKRLN